MGKSKRAIGIIGLIGAIAVAAMIAHRAGLLPPSKIGKAENAAAPSAVEPRPVPVTVAIVTPRPILRKTPIVGSLFGLEEITVSAKVEGRIARIHHDVGDVVRPGDVLLEVDDVDCRLAADEAERGLELELAKLGLKALPPENFDINALPAVARAAAVEKNATVRLERAQRLVATSAYSKEELERFELAHRVSSEDHRQAILEAQTNLAAVNHRQAILEVARQKLRDCKVITPDFAVPGAPVTLAAGARQPTREKSFDCVVAERFVSEGEMLRVSPDTTMAIFRLVIDHPLKLKGAVPERYLGEIKVGQAVELSVEAYPNEVFPGRVVRVNPTVDRANRTFMVEIEAANESRRLSAGSFAKGLIHSRIDAAALTVPEEAIVSFAGVDKVFIVVDGVAKEVPVALGARIVESDRGERRHWREATGALESGMQVITSGHAHVSDGKRVRVRGDNVDSATE